MKNSPSRMMFIFLFFLQVACATSYKIFNVTDDTSELVVHPSRIQLECEQLTDADQPDLAGFMIHVLDEKNTVTTFVQTNTLHKDACNDAAKKIEKILTKGIKIFIGGMGNELNQPRVIGKRYYLFGKSSYPENGRVLKFMVILNENGLCFDPYMGGEAPCPAPPFPTKPLNFNAY